MAMWKTTLSLVVVLVGGCSEAPDELTPYLAQLEKMQKYHDQLSRYEVYLSNPGLERQARDVREVIQAYHEEMETFGATKDKYIMAGHNSVKRSLERGLKKIVEPDFPTYTISARKQIRNMREAVTNHLENLEKLWVEAGKTGPFPVTWPVSE